MRKWLWASMEMTMGKSSIDRWMEDSEDEDEENCLADKKKEML